jgi:hypothetical protein
VAFKPRDEGGTALLDQEEKEPSSKLSGEGEEDTGYDVGVLAGLEYSPVKNADLSDRQKVVMKELRTKAEKRDYPARLIEVIQAWEAALFYRGFQFLIPQRGGGWIIPGESTGYGPTMQMDLALLPTNIYSARAQMIIAALTRTVPNVRFGPQNSNRDADITAADSADKFVKVIKRNNDLIMVQNDAARYCWTDGRFMYWSRFERNGEKYGWEEEDEPDDIIPETEPQAEMDHIEKQAMASETPEGEGSRGSVAEGELGSNPDEMETETPAEGEAHGESEIEGEEEKPTPLVNRTPLGQEVRTCHGKLEVKVVPMMANDQCDMDAIVLSYEVDLGRARAMFPWCADKIRGGDQGVAEAEIARLARQNVKLGMQSTYVTSDSFADDVTITRVWMRPAYFMHAPEDERDGLIELFPNGCLQVWAGDVFCYARNESMDDSCAVGQAYAGDGQNRNAMGTSTLPVQKRLNNWLDLMNDLFVRAVPKKWMDSKAFNIDALRQQTNIPGDIAGFKQQGNRPVSELIFVEPQVTLPAPLTDFINKYAGDLAELLSGAYPALAGGDTGSADSGVAIATQRDSALGRLSPTWHAIKNCEAKSMKQLVTWGAKCRNKSIREKIPGGETIELEIADLKGNIMCYAESDENFPETYTQKQNKVTQIFTESVKNPQLAEELYNPDNLELLRSVTGLRELYLEPVESRNKQLGEIELLTKSKPIPKPEFLDALMKIKMMEETILQNGGDTTQLQQAKQELANSPDEQKFETSIQIDKDIDDNSVEAWTCQKYLRSPAGRRLKVAFKPGWLNLKLHMLDHKNAAAAEAAQAAAGQPGKPPSESINYKDVAANDPAAAAALLSKGGLPASTSQAPALPAPGATAPAAVPPNSAGPAKGPAAPIPAGTPEGAGGAPKK